MASFNVAYHDRRRLDGPSLGSSPLQSPDEDDTRFGGMRQTKATATDEVRAAEVIASMCLATDLGMGFPFEHGLHATLTTMRLCEVLDVDEDTTVGTYYACLLMYAGCTVDGVERSQIFGGSMTE